MSGRRANAARRRYTFTSKPASSATSRSPFVLGAVEFGAHRFSNSPDGAAGTRPHLAVAQAGGRQQHHRIPVVHRRHHRREIVVQAFRLANPSEGRAASLAAPDAPRGQAQAAPASALLTPAP